MDKIQKFGITFLVIFAVIIGFTLILYNNCQYTNCANGVIITQVLYISIVSAGLIGVIYSFLLLRGLDKENDELKSIIENDDKLDDFLNDENNDKKKLLSF